jgi:hypothetical protein
VLTITPHIIRNPDITQEDLAPVWVGTENRITIFGNSPRVRSGVEASPFGEPPQATGEGDESDPGSDERSGEAERNERTKPRLSFPQPPAPDGQGPPVGMREPGSGQKGKTNNPNEPMVAPDTEQAATTVSSEAALARITFYPARLPVVERSEGVLTVVLDPGAAGVNGPLNFAYDPARLEVVKVEGGDLPGSGGNQRVQVTHTPALGWITAWWSGEASGGGTVMRLTVRPLVAGELPVIFAGPAGALVATPATVVGLPAAVVATEVRQP